MNTVILENIQYQLVSKLGLNIELVHDDWKGHLGTLRGGKDYALFRIGWGGTYPDPYNYMTLMTTDEPNNYTGWGHPEYDRLVRKGAAQTDPNLKRRAYQRATEILVHEEAAVIPLLQGLNHDLVSSRTKNFIPNFFQTYPIYKYNFKEPVKK